jgi:predicted Zn-dependent protease
MKLVLLLVLLLGPVQDSGSAKLRREALARDVSALPQAELGDWAERWQDVETLPAELKTSYAAALGAYRAGDLPLALHHLQVLLEAYPDFPAAQHQLAVVCFRLHRYGDARAAMIRFLAHAPEQVGRTRVLGHALYGLGLYAQARRHYGRVLAAKPEDLEARFGDGLAAWRLGQADEALANFDAVLAGRPDHADASYWRAQVLFEGERGEPEDWLAAAERAAELAPFDPRPVYLRSQVLFELGRDQQAAQARARFEELDGATRELRRLEGLLLLDPSKVEQWREVVRLRGAIGDRGGLRRARAALELAMSWAE